MIRAWIKNLRFDGGPEVKLNENSILVLVGPHNSGKSASLLGIYDSMVNGVAVKSPVLSASLSRKSSVQEVKAELVRPHLHGSEYRIGDRRLAGDEIGRLWTQARTSLHVGPLRDLVASFSNAAGRLSDCEPCKTRDFRQPDRDDHPFQTMYQNPEIEEQVSATVKRALNGEFAIHRSAGSMIPAYFGVRPTLAAGENLLSRSYATRLADMAPLEAQGDAIKSFVSLVGRLLTDDCPIALIDDPEAFLRPAQARQIGEEIAVLAKGQVLVATHSAEVLQGLLSAAPGRVSVVRLSSGRPARQLGADQVVKLWTDPVLRFGKILDGLFHNGTVITEGDADCRFYQAVADIAVPARERPDIQFTYSGGKQRSATLVRASAGLGVPAVTVVDVDILNNENALRSTIEASGGKWVDFEADWRGLKTVVEAGDRHVDATMFKKLVATELEAIGEASAVSPATLSAIRKLCKDVSPWSELKEAGIGSLPSGEPVLAADRFLSDLRRLGIFVLPNGRMEGFDKSIGKQGPSWVNQALLKDMSNPDYLVDAKAFVTEFLERFRFGDDSQEGPPSNIVKRGSSGVLPLKS